MADSCLIVILFIKANQADVKSMKKLMPLLDKMQLKSHYADMSKVQSKGLYFLLIGEYQKAKLLVQKIIKNPAKYEIKDEMQEFLIILFNANLMQNNFNHCYDILYEYKLYNGHYVKVNYSYINLLLNHITDDTKIYFYKNQYEEFPEMFWQLNVIKALKMGDQLEAK